MCATIFKVYLDYVPIETEGIMIELKEREARILEYMKQEVIAKGYPPTVREICSA